MRRSPILLAVCVFVAASARAQTHYVYGSFCSYCAAPSNLNQFYDDGAHDDGLAGDGVYGAIIVVDKPAGQYGFNEQSGAPGPYASTPSCWCAPPPAYAKLWTTGPGDEIHFRLGGHPSGVGWAGQAISAGSHGIPAGAQLEATDNPYYGLADWVPAQHVGNLWQCTMTEARAGVHNMMFRTTDQTVQYTATYNCWCPCPYGEQPTATFTTTQPNATVLLQFDPESGLMRGVEEAPTPTRARTWGTLKSTYR